MLHQTGRFGVTQPSAAYPGEMICTRVQNHLHGQLGTMRVYLTSSVNSHAALHAAVFHGKVTQLKLEHSLRVISRGAAIRAAGLDS